MTSKKWFIEKFISDVRNGSSHSVDYLLKGDAQECLSVTGIYARKLFAPLLRLAYRAQTPYKIRIDYRKPLSHSKKGRIFAINHRQGDDIVISANVVGRSAYIVFGNKHLALDTLNGLGLWAYGMILLDRESKINRNDTYKKMKFVIEHGGNIIIYPEGYWNLDDNGEADDCHGADGHNSENWLIQDINVGILRLAKETGCEIVPTVLHYDEFQKKRCYASRGVPFRVTTSDDVFAKKDELVAIMWDMSFALMEKYSSYERATLEAQGVPLRAQWEAMKEELRSACDIPCIGYRLDLADEKRIGKAKVATPVITPSEAFAHLSTLIPCRENAFLLRER